MNQLKKLMLFRLLILLIQLKNDYNTNINEIKNKINGHDHAKYISPQEFKKLKSEKLSFKISTS